MKHAWMIATQFNIIRSPKWPWGQGVLHALYLLLSERPELILKVATSYTNAIAVQNKHRTQCRRFGAYHHLNSKTKAEKDAEDTLLVNSSRLSVQALSKSLVCLSKKRRRKKKRLKNNVEKKKNSGERLLFAGPHVNTMS